MWWSIRKQKAAEQCAADQEYTYQQQKAQKRSNAADLAQYKAQYAEILKLKQNDELRNRRVVLAGSIARLEFLATNEQYAGDND